MEWQGWVMTGFVASLCTLPIYFFGMYASTKRAQRTGGSGVNAGGALGLDEFFHPNAHQARAIWDAEQVLPAPAPSTGDPPSDLTSGHITIDVQPS